MRILFDCFPTTNPNNGMDTYCKMLTKYFKKLAPFSQDNPDVYCLLMEKKDGYWLELNDKKVFWKFFYKYISPFLFYTDKHIIHCSYFFPRSKYFYVNLFKNRNTKRILTVHHLNHLEEFLPLKDQKYFKDLIYKYIKASDHIVCISKTTEKTLHNQFPNETKHKTTVIYNGTDKWDKEIIAPKYKPDFEFLYFVGQISEKKNIHVILPILQNSKLHFIIAGVHSSKEYIDKIIDEAKKLDVLDRVHLIGSVSENDKHWYYKNCTAFVFPSLAEGFGLPVVEAMHYGKPCLLSNLDALVEISGNLAYYIENYDKEYIQSFYHKSMEHYNRTQPQKAIIDMANTYNWEKSAKQYLALYSKILSEK